MCLTPRICHILKVNRSILSCGRWQSGYENDESWIMSSLQTGFILSETSSDGQYYRPWQAKKTKHEDYWLINGLARRIDLKSKLPGSVCSFAVCFSIYRSIHSCSHPLIHPSRKSSSIALGCCCEWEAVSLNLKYEGRKDLTFFFFSYLPEKQHRLYSLQLLSHLCPSSSFFLFSSSRLPPFRDLKITARRMTPLSSFSLFLYRRWRFKVLF